MSFDALGLRPDADEREVRRAYARLLKSNRPDDDPVAFQALHEAYQDCLQQIRDARWESEREAMECEGAAAGKPPGVEAGTETAEDAAAPPLPPAGERAPLPRPGERVEALPEPSPSATADTHPAPGEPSDAARADAPPHAADAAHADAPPDAGNAPADEDPGFVFSAFIHQLLEQARQLSAARLSDWLYSQPDLYSIRLKTAITPGVVSTITNAEPPLGADRLKAIGEFFGIHQLGPRDWWLVERLEQAQLRADLRQRFRSGQLPRSAPGVQSSIDAMMDHELANARWSWRMLPLSFLPTLPTRTRDRILELDHLTGGLSEELVEPRRRAWFMELADRGRISARRLALSALRTLVFGGLFLGLVEGLAAGTVDRTMVLMVATWGGVFLGWQVATALYVSLARWLESRGWGPYLREGLVLSAGLGALGTGLVTSTLLPYVLAVAALGYAVTLRRRFEGGLTGLMLAVGDAVLTGPEGIDWPIPAGVTGLVLAAVMVLALDRIQSRVTGLPLRLVTQDGLWLRRLAAGVFCGVALGALGLALLPAG